MTTTTAFNVHVWTKEDWTEFSTSWKWMLGTGVLFVLLGALAVLMPFPTTLGLTIYIGALFLVRGVLSLPQSYKLRHRRGATTRFVMSILALVGGALFLRYPGSGMLTVAMILSFYFFLNSVLQFVTALSMRPHRGWAWTMLGSVTSFAVGVLIILSFPFSALWVPGFLFGVDLIVVGTAMIGTGIALRKHHRGSQVINYGNPLHSPS